LGPGILVGLHTTHLERAAARGGACAALHSLSACQNMFFPACDGSHQPAICLCHHVPFKPSRSWILEHFHVLNASLSAHAEFVQTAVHCPAVLASLPYMPTWQLGAGLVLIALLVTPSCVQTAAKRCIDPARLPHTCTQRAKTKRSIACTTRTLFLHAVECVGTHRVAVTAASPPHLRVTSALSYRFPRESGPQLTPGSVPCLWSCMVDWFCYIHSSVHPRVCSQRIYLACVLGWATGETPPLVR
jgi:hypothetical protein